MSRHFKVDEFLQTKTPEERAEYDAIARDARTTVDAAQAWLVEHGYDGSRHSTANHKKSFDEVLKGVRRSAEMASSFGQVLREGGTEHINEAVLGRFQQLLMGKLMEMEAEDADTGDLLKLAMSVRQTIGSAKDLRKMLAEKFEQEMTAEAQKRTDRTITPEQIADARKRIFGC